MADKRPSDSEPALAEGSDAWSDLVLTLPMFVGYHIGIIFLPFRNAADVVTRELVALADHNMGAYGGLTVGIGLVYVLVLGLAGRGHALKWQRFALIAAEGVVYAVAMRVVSTFVVGEIFLGPEPLGKFAALVMSFGAGFYEEVAFRVILFGLGLKAIRLIEPPGSGTGKVLVPIVWALLTSCAFSAWHYVGEFGDPFELRSFVFRWVCGLAFTLIYAFRGFAPVVWTHTLYDVWVMVF